MRLNLSSSSTCLPVMVSIHLPSMPADAQPFPHAAHTYLPAVIALAEAEAMLRAAVRDGAIAHLMETLGLDEARALATVPADSITIEFMPVG